MSNEDEVQKWMEEVAKGNKNPRTKLVFDPKTKRLVAVPPWDARADQNLTFDPEEARRFENERGEHDCHL